MAPTEPVAWCGLHKRGISEKQIRLKKCREKNCRHLKKYRPRFQPLYADEIPQRENKNRKDNPIMKKFVPKLVKLSEEAVASIPAALAADLPAGHMAYAIKPEENGSVFVSDAPIGIGHICTFVKSEDVEFLPKVTAKSPRVNIDVTIKANDEDSGLNSANITKTLAVTVPENVTDEELLAVISAAGKNLKQYRDTMCSEQPDMNMHTLMAAYLTDYMPGETVVLMPDMQVTVEI